METDQTFERVRRSIAARLPKVALGVVRVGEWVMFGFGPREPHILRVKLRDLRVFGAEEVADKVIEQWEYVRQFPPPGGFRAPGT